MATSSQLDLAAYMSNSIRTIMAKAYKSMLSNPREANTLTPDMVKQVVCFGSSAIIKSPVPQMRELLQARGITVSEKEFYTYDPKKGDPKQGIPPGTQFEDLPETWRCPRCKQLKEKFNKA
jgi:rubredoxin